MISVICMFIDYSTKDGSGRFERSIFNSRCSLYFLQCILSSFCRKTRKWNCTVKFFVAILRSSAFSSSILPIILTVNDPFSHSSIPIGFLLLQIFKPVRHTPQEFKLPLLLKKSLLIFIHWSIGQLIITELRTDWSECSMLSETCNAGFSLWFL